MTRVPAPHVRVRQVEDGGRGPGLVHAAHWSWVHSEVVTVDLNDALFKTMTRGPQIVQELAPELAPRDPRRLGVCPRPAGLTVTG